MAYHYGKDALTVGVVGSTGNQLVRNALLYHFMRVGGCDWLWECDGEVGPYAVNPNHAVDGNMEAGGAASWTAISAATITKDTATVERGKQSLKVVTPAAPGDGVVSASLLSMANASGRAFTALDTLNGPVNDQMTLYDDAAAFTQAMVGALITITGEGSAGNNGTFVITKYVNTSTIVFQNASGATATPPTGSYTINMPYELVLWANCTSTWNVLVDRGTGSLTLVGTIASTGGTWQKQHFSFETYGTGARSIQIVDPVGGNTIYIDSVMVFRSLFEYQRLNVYGTQGVLTNPDQFSCSDAYVPGAKDVGRYLFVWDPDHPKNSGYYKIIANVGGGVVQVDLRSGTQTFTTHGTANLVWRIVDIDNPFLIVPTTTLTTSGFGVESPHSSAWRFFLRGTGTTNATQHVCIWAAPEDTAFDSSTGTFYNDGPSTQRGRQGAWENWHSSLTPTYFQHGSTIPYSGSPVTTRTFIMTDDDVSFINVVHLTSATIEGAFSVGYTGADADHPGIEEFVVLAKSNWANAPNEIDIYASTSWASAMWYYGTGFDKQGNAVHSSLGTLGMYQSAATDPVALQTNNSDNPWSGEEVIYPMTILRDVEGTVGCPSEREETGMGIVQARSTLPTLATFDSNAYLHFYSGVCWEWNGESIL